MRRQAVLSLDPKDLEASINRFCAAHRAGADLIEDVLCAMTPADRNFLLATSVAEMVNSELADQLTGRTDSRLVWKSSSTTATSSCDPDIRADTAISPCSGTC